MRFLDSSIKTNWKYIAIVVVFALFVGAITVWFTQFPQLNPPQTQTISIPKAPTPQQQLDTSTPSTSSGQAWQTYRSEEFGFEVRYP